MIKVSIVSRGFFETGHLFLGGLKVFFTVVFGCTMEGHLYVPVNNYGTYPSRKHRKHFPPNSVPKSPFSRRLPTIVGCGSKHDPPGRSSCMVDQTSRF